MSRKSKRARGKAKNRSFGRTAVRTRKINVKPRIMRGGIRL